MAECDRPPPSFELPGWEALLRQAAAAAGYVRVARGLVSARAECAVAPLIADDLAAALALRCASRVACATTSPRLRASLCSATDRLQRRSRAAVLTLPYATVVRTGLVVDDRD